MKTESEINHNEECLDETSEPSRLNTKVDEIPPRINPIKLKRILVPTDFSRTSCKALRYALSLARLLKAKITLLYVAEFLPVDTFYLPAGKALLMDEQAKLNDSARKLIEPDLFDEALSIRGETRNVITDVARRKKIDLIVISTHGYTGLKRAFNGSTADEIVRRAPCPVLVVRENERDFA